MVLRFGRRLPLHRNGAAARTFACTGVRMGTLAANRQTASMPQTSVRSDFHQPLDIEGNFLSEIAFDAVLFFDDFADLVGFVVVQITNLRVHIDTGGAQDLIGYRATDAE